MCTTIINPNHTLKLEIETKSTIKEYPQDIWSKLTYTENYIRIDFYKGKNKVNIMPRDVIIDILITES